MQAIVNTRRGPIIFGGLITSIARVLGLRDKFSWLTPLPPRVIDINMTRSMKLVKRRRDGKFHLMVANNVFQDFILPNPIRTYVRNPESYCYTHDPVPNQVPAHILENVAAGGDINEDYIQEQAAPATDTHPNTAHISSKNVAGKSSNQRPRRRNVAPATLDDIYVELLRRRELDAHRDQQIQNMEAYQTKMIQILRQMQHDQHDYAFRIEQNMSDLIDEMATMTMRVEDLQEYAFYVGPPPHQPGNGGHGRTRSRRRQ